MQLQHHCWDQMLMEGIRTRQTHFHWYNQLLHYMYLVLALPSHHIAVQKGTGTTICCIDYLVLALHSLHGTVKKNRNKVVASEGLCNDPHTLVQSMQILDQSHPIMYQQLSSDGSGIQGHKARSNYFKKNSLYPRSIHHRLSFILGVPKSQNRLPVHTWAIIKRVLLSESSQVRFHGWHAATSLQREIATTWHLTHTHHEWWLYDVNHSHLIH